MNGNQAAAVTHKATLNMIFCPLRQGTVRLWMIAVGSAMILDSATAQTTNFSDLRDLRVACLESFNTAKTRLEDLHGFVEGQAGRERTAADQLFQLQQNAASAKRRNAELRQRNELNSAKLERVQAGIERATASYRTAAAALPNGENWAAEGSAALKELRRAADAAPRDEWKHKRVLEVEAEFVSTLREWRAARRSIEQASFDLELRAAPSVFKRVAEQISAVDKELRVLDTQLAERQTTLAEQVKKSENWGAAIRNLREGEAKARKQLADAGFKFHLVDLKFTAWRLKHSGDKDYGLELMPDVLERIAPKVDPTDIPGQSGSILSPGADSYSTLSGSHHEDRMSLKEEAEANEKDDSAFRDILARVNLAQARLSFVSEVWRAETGGVQAAIDQLEETEERARSLSDDTARLAADLESLRRSLETEQRTLGAGAETLDLVRKRFATDLGAINQLLEDAAARTAKLAKGLE